MLVVEDDETLARAIERQLKDHWKQVKAVYTVQQGLVEAATGKYDVVLSDWDVPLGGGRVMIERCPLPVVIYTGGWLDALAQHTNGTRLVQKPARTATLNVALYQAYKKSCL